jgi:hypothetical protein
MSTRIAIVAVTLALGVAATAVLVRVPSSPSVSPLGRTTERKTPPAAKSAATNGKAPEFYGDNVRSALFARPMPNAPAPAPPQPETVTSDPMPQIPAGAVAPDTMAEYVYSGTVTAGGEMQALLENPRTREGWYVQRGDAFLGAKVTQIDANAVTLEVHGQTRRIPKSSAYNLVPLNAQAGSPVDKSAPPTPGGVPQVNVLTAENAPPIPISMQMLLNNNLEYASPALSDTFEAPSGTMISDIDFVTVNL